MTGEIPVKEGQVIELVAAAGGKVGNGVANAVSEIIISQQWCNNPKNPRRAVGYVQQSGAGGAGGSYLAPSVRLKGMVEAGRLG